MKRYFLRQDEQNNVYVSNLLEVAPDNSIEFYSNNFIKPKFDKFPEPTTLIEGATQEEIEEYNKPFVPQEVHNHKLRLALIHFGIMPSEIDMAIEAMTDLTMREKIYTLWNFAPMLERADTSLNYMSTQFEISQENLDQIFIYANSLK